MASAKSERTMERLKKEYDVHVTKDSKVVAEFYSYRSRCKTKYI